MAMLAPVLAAAPPASAVDVVVTDWLVETFDGTFLAVTTFWPSTVNAANRAPFVLLASEWGETRLTQPTGRVNELLLEGYGVLTWDSRGFGASSGEAYYASPQHEVKDAYQLVTFLLYRAPVRTDNPGDPLVAIEGVGAGAGLALLAAANDGAVDVVIAKDGWSDLRRALAPGGVPKIRWLREIALAGEASSCMHGRIPPTTLGPGCVSDEVLDWWIEAETTGESVRGAPNWTLRSPLTYQDLIRVPTLLQQGFPDTLYDARQGIDMHNALRARGVPTKLWIDDGAHGASGTQEALATSVANAWLRCYLKVPADCSGVTPGIDYLDGAGAWQSTPTWPPAQWERSALFNIGGIVGLPASTAPAYPAVERPPCTGLCEFALDVVDGSTTAPLKICPATGPCGTMTGGASIAIDTGATGVAGILFASLSIRTPDGTLTPVQGQVVPMRIPAILETVGISATLPDVSAAPGPGEILVLHFTADHPDYANARVPFTADMSGRVRWLTTV